MRITVKTREKTTYEEQYVQQQQLLLYIRLRRVRVANYFFPNADVYEVGPIYIYIYVLYHEDTTKTTVYYIVYNII